MKSSFGSAKESSSASSSMSSRSMSSPSVSSPSASSPSGSSPSGSSPSGSSPSGSSPPGSSPPSSASSGSSVSSSSAPIPSLPTHIPTQGPFGGQMFGLVLEQIGNDPAGVFVVVVNNSKSRVMFDSMADNPKVTVSPNLDISLSPKESIKLKIAGPDVIGVTVFVVTDKYGTYSIKLRV